MLADWAYFRDVDFFVSPIRQGKNDLVIREDSFGNGYFNAPRSGGRTHRGVDIEAPLRTEVRAAKGGMAVLYFQPKGMGKYIVIRHTGGYSTLYGHLSEFNVKDGARVRQNGIIGYVGKTGNASSRNIAPHLHFEITENGEYTDPLEYIIR